MTPQQAAAYRGSEPDHVAPQFIPMPGSLLPGQQPGIAAPEGAYPQPAFGQPAAQLAPPFGQQSAQVSPQPSGQQPVQVPQQSYGQQTAQVPPQPFGQQAAQVPPLPGQQSSQVSPQPFGQQAAQVPPQPFGQPAAQVPQAMGQPFAYAQPQPVSPAMQPELPPQPQSQPQPDVWASRQPYADPDLQTSPGQQGHWQQPAAVQPQPHAWPQPFPAAGGQAASPLQPSPYAPEPTVLVRRTPTAAPTLPPAPAMLIPDDYDPLADLAAPRAPAQGWPQAMPPAGVTAGGLPPMQAVQPGPPTVMQTMGPGAGWPAHQAAAPGAWNGAGQPAIPASWPEGQAQAAMQPTMQAGWPGAAQPHSPQHGQAQPAAGWAVQPSSAAGWTPPAPGPQAWPGQTGQGDAVLQALLRGMGLSALQLSRDPVQTAELAGAMLREAVAGTMAVLMARAMTKRESRLDMTVLGAQANNPLKFFPDAESALAQMLTNAMSGYMPPVKAIGSAFDDLKAHELAVIAGMRAALKGVMARFDPAQIEANEPQGVMDKMMAATRKARMWDSMVALYDDIVREADDDFQHLFGEKFSAAYEDQIGRLHRNP
jgi:FHA domain-containing protein/type VI secretion system protein